MYTQTCARCAENLPLDAFAYDEKKVRGRTQKTRSAICKLCDFRRKLEIEDRLRLSVQLSIQGAQARIEECQARIRSQRSTGAMAGSGAVQECRKCSAQLPLDEFAFENKRVNGRVKKTRAEVCKLCGLKYKLESIDLGRVSFQQFINSAQQQRNEFLARHHADRARQDRMGIL